VALFAYPPHQRGVADPPKLTAATTSKLPPGIVHRFNLLPSVAVFPPLK
jgi:hypothetical protein